jgi:transglutaminase-like putative cysteine protease
MQQLTIRHETRYHYRREVAPGPHRLMLRPRESHMLRLIDHRLTMEPAADVIWANDVFGNAVATATFDAPCRDLHIVSTATLRLDVEQWPVFPVTAGAAQYPFTLAQDDMTDLGALRLQAYLDSRGRLAAWARDFVAGNPTDTLSLLKDICAGVAAAFSYEVREDEGVQTPEETLDRRCGSCRDFAVLFADAVRSLGFGARIVSGYLYDADRNSVGSAGDGSTHAWAEVFVPGAGWITFDPTNRSVGGYNLIPTAVARDIHQVSPVSGSYTGPPDALERLDVAVTVREADGDPQPAEV